MLAANNWNVCQYAILMHMMADISGLKVGELVHVIADAHIYDRHIPIIKEIISKTPFDAPKLIKTEDVTDFYKFTADTYQLEGYKFNEFTTKIPVAI